MAHAPLFKLQPEPSLVNAKKDIDDQQHQRHLAYPDVPGQIESHEQPPAAVPHGQQNRMRNQEADRGKRHIFVVSNEDVQSEGTLNPFDSGGKEKLNHQDHEPHKGKVAPHIIEGSFRWRTQKGCHPDRQGHERHIESDFEQSVTHGKHPF